MTIKPKQIAFVEAYFRNSMNATDAYQEIYPKCSRESARRNGSRLLTNADIIAFVQERLLELKMFSDEVLLRLAEQARASMAYFIKVTPEGFVYFDFSQPEAKEHMHLIKKMKSKRTRRIEGGGKEAQEWEDETVEVEMVDSQAALRLIGLHHKLFATETPPINLRLNIEGLDTVLDKAYGNLASNDGASETEKK